MSDLSGDDLAASILAEVEGPSAAAKKSSMLPTILAVAVLTVVAVGGGAGVGLMLGSKAEPAAETAAAPEAAAEDGAAADEEGKVLSLVIKLDPVTTTITSPAKTLLRIEASIVIRPDQVENPEVLAAEIRGDTLTFLRTVELAQVEGSRGLLHLREDLRERAMLRSPAVTDYLIQSLVAQ